MLADGKRELRAVPRIVRIVQRRVDIFYWVDGSYRFCIAVIVVDRVFAIFNKGFVGHIFYALIAFAIAPIVAQEFDNLRFVAFVPNFVGRRLQNGNLIVLYLNESIEFVAFYCLCEGNKLSALFSLFQRFIFVALAKIGKEFSVFFAVFLYFIIEKRRSLEPFHLNGLLYRRRCEVPFVVGKYFMLFEFFGQLIILHKLEICRFIVTLLLNIILNCLIRRVLRVILLCYKCL